MTALERFPRAPLAALCTALALALCTACDNDGAENGVETDTETNWLMACDTDGECGSYSCECGVCTSRCQTDTECPMPGAVCGRAGEREHDALCGEATGSVGVCLDPDRFTSQSDDDAPTEADGDDDVPTAEGVPDIDAGGPNPPSTTVLAPTPSAPITPSTPMPSDAPVTPAPNDAGQVPPPDSSVAPNDAGVPSASMDAGRETTACPDAMASCDGDLLSGYLLWDRPGGVAGTGPALELLEDGSLRLWTNTEALEPRATAEWDFETVLGPEQVNELVRLLLAVDTTDLPHEVPFLECYPSLYFEGPGGELIDLDYGGADGLLPEMQGVYDWFDALLLEVAPSFVGPSAYCPPIE